MTITVTAPTGETVDFPDGTDHATINGVMTQHFHPETGSVTTPDKYQQAAIDEAKSNPAIDDQAGYTRRLVHGITMGADSTLAAGAFAPLEAIRHGVGLGEGYNYAKAREDRVMDLSRQNTGALGTAAEVLGGGVTGAGLASGGLTTARMLAPNAGLLARSASAAADAGAMGGVAGGMEGNGLAERFNNAIKGMATGAAVGGLTPAALKIAGAALSPVVSNFRAWQNPGAFAQSQVARGIHESGIDPNELSRNVVAAGNDGQGAFTVADAMGNPGQRLLSTVTRAPGEGRTAAIAALDARQAGQARRVAGTLAEGFNAPETAAQTEARLTGARSAQADQDFSAVRSDAGRVDTVPALNHIDSIIGTEPGQTLTAPNDSIESVLTGFRQRLARVNPDDFEAVQRIRGEMADAAQSAAQTGNGNRARLLRGATAQLDTAMENASPGYRAANANFAQNSRNIDAVQAGRNAAMRGRTEDTIPAFQALTPPARQAFRSGYADPLIADAQKSPFGTNAARPLTNPAFQDEAAVMAPGNNLMQQRLARENTMFETRNAAMGGSKTVDNANDHAAMAVDPHLIGAVGHIMHGNVGGAVASVGRLVANGWHGNTPAVRKAVADVLLQNGHSLASAALKQMVDSTVARLQFMQNLARGAGRAASGGLAVSRPGQK